MTATQTKPQAKLNASQSLKGKTALVTGGSRGIGAAIARALAEEGAHVAISYVSSANAANELAASLSSEYGVNAVAYRADQGDAQQVSQLVDAVYQEFGQLDILVNSAGVAVAGAVDDESVDAQAMARQFDINVHGVAAAVRAAATRMTEGGRIISLSSCLGSRTPFAGMADYSATKATVNAYTQGWARDLGPRGITVNAVAPGPINTDMNPDDGEQSDYQRSLTALGRYGRPDEIAAAVVFLASPKASYITGATLAVDGGINA